jgi:hypothetical protein
MFPSKLLSQLMFFSCLAGVFILGVVPRSPFRPPPHIDGWTKADHLIAFFVLTVISTPAFPKARPLVIGVLLSGFGGLIEIVQALPFINRDGRFNDWLIDTLAILTALGPILLAARREAPGLAMSAAIATDYAAE